MILIHQARLLIGRPMIAVLDALLPEAAVAAALRFEGGFSFNLDLPRMRLVTDDLLANVATEPEESSSWDSGNDGYSSSEEQQRGTGVRGAGG